MAESSTFRKLIDVETVSDFILGGFKITADGNYNHEIKRHLLLWRRKWQPTPAFLLGESRGQRSLVDYRPQCHKELDTTETGDTYRLKVKG